MGARTRPLREGRRATICWMPTDAITICSIPDDSMPDDSMPDGSNPDGSIPDDSTLNLSTGTRSTRSGASTRRRSQE